MQVSDFELKLIYLLPSNLLDTFHIGSRYIIGRNPSMVIPLLANQDLTPMLCLHQHCFDH